MKKIYTIFLLTGMLFSKSNQAQTTYNDVANIFFSHCTGCHHPGGIGPVSLMSYSVCSTNAASIKTDLTSGKMPPWLPDTAYGNVRFLHEQIISLADKNLILKWISDGTKQGDPTLAPSAPYYDDYAYKLCPTPTMVLKMKPRKIAHNEGTDCYPIQTNLPKARYLRAYEIVPGNSAIVNFVLVGISAASNVPGVPTLPPIPGIPIPTIPPVPGVALTNDTTGACYFPAVSSSVGAYSPNAAPTVWPGKAPLRAGMLIPANAQLNLQIHYTAGALGKYDSTQIRLYFYPDTATNVRNITTTTDINNLTLLLFPNQVTTVIDSIAIDSNRSVLGIFPNAHSLCTKMNVDGVSKIPNIPLLNIKSWNKKFASFYTYQKLVKFPSTYKLRASDTYDNTTANPNNPKNPPQLVTYSPSDTGEVQFDAIEWLRYKTGDENIDIQALLKCDTLLVCKPGAAGIITGTSTICLGQTGVAYSISPIGNAATYTWAYSGLGATIHGNGTSVTVDFGANTTAGNLTVKGVNTCGVSGSVSPNKAISINSGGTVGAAGIIIGTSSVCKSQTGVVYSVPVISGAVSYTWSYSGIGATISGTTNSVTVNFSSTATSGNLTVMGANTCVNGAVSATYPITVNAIPSTPTITVVNNCGSSDLTSSVSPGTYLWSPGGQTTQAITVSVAGTYSVTISSGGSCSATSIGTVVSITPSPSISGVTNNSRCGTGTVVLGAATASNGTINWYSSATDVNSLHSGTSYTTASISNTTIYYVDVTSNGCTSTPRTAVTATVNNGATATMSGAGKVCTGSNGVVSIALSGTQPFSFTYGSAAGSNSVNAISSSTYTFSATAGTYTVGSVTDGSGCPGSGTGGAITLTENPVISLTTPTVTCNGGNTAYTVDFDMSGGDVSSYAVTGAGNKTTATHFTSSTIATGTAFSFSVTDTYHCSPIAVVNGGSPNCGCLASASISTSNSAICTGGAATISVALGGTGPWSITYAIDGVNQAPISGINSSPYTFTTSTTGAYTVATVRDANCTNTGIGTANVSHISLSATVTGGGGICTGGTRDLNFTLTGGTAPWSFTYTNGTNSFGPISSPLPTKIISLSAAGNYSIVSMTAGSCTAAGAGSSTSVVMHSLPQVGASVSPSAIVCSGTSITLTGTGTATTYVWTGGHSNGQSFGITSPQGYTVTGTDANNCSATASVNITVNALPVINPISNPSGAAVCFGGSVTLSGNGSLQYDWLGTDPNVSVFDGVAFVPSRTDSYTVSATDANNCTGYATKGVSVLLLPLVGISANPPVSICKGSSVTLTGTGAATYVWSDGIVNGVAFSPTTTATYTVTGKNGFNCSNTSSKEIKVNVCPGEVGITEVSGSSQEISVYPNPTTGIFNISVKNASFKELNISVVNMLGSEVFNASDKNNSTDYTLEINLEDLSKGMYYLRINAGTDTKIKKLIIQ